MSRPRRADGCWLTRRAGVFYIEWYDPAARRCRRRSTGHRDREDAALALARHRIEQAAPSRPDDPERIAVADCLTRYLTAVAEQPSALQAAIAVEKWLAPHFGLLTVAEIRPAVVAAFTTEARLQGLSDGYIARILSVLRAALRREHAAGRLTAAPHIAAPPAAPPRERWLSPDEVGRLITAATAPHVRRYVVMALATAARPAALLQLDWSQVDLASQRLFLQPPARRTRSNKRRPVVAISEFLAAELTHTPPAERRGPVIAYQGRALVGIRQAIRRAAARAGLADVTPYPLRHTALSMMAHAGVPLAEIAQAAGHTSTRMVERHYLHWTPEHTARAMAVTGAFLASFSPALHETPPTQPDNPLETMVGAARIELATPTMSTQRGAGEVVDFPRKVRARKGRT